jgi:hypothetical protein
LVSNKAKFPEIFKKNPCTFLIASSNKSEVFKKNAGQAKIYKNSELAKNLPKKKKIFGDFKNSGYLF